MAVELAESVGVHLDDWQQHCVRCILAEGDDGRWAAFEAAVVVARQNGKGEILLAIELAGLFILGERLILHSAHEFKTAQEAFLRLVGVIDGSPDLSRRVRRKWTSHGQEGIELVSGQRLRFLARSKSSGRGFTADRTILDEAQQLPIAAMAALLPTLSAVDNPQVVYAGTVPGPYDDGAYLTSVRDRAMSGNDPGLMYLGWTFDLHDEDIDAIDFADPDVWAAQNPAMGIRISSEAIAREHRAFGENDEVFGRERLSVWPISSDSSLIGAERWSALKGVEDVRPSPVALAVTVSLDRKWSTIGLAGRRIDGGTHLQVVQSGKGTAWVVDRVVELVGEHDPVSVVVDPAGPEGSLIPALTAADVAVHRTSDREYSHACGMFLDAVNGVDEVTGEAVSSVHHSGQDVLTIAVTALKRQRRGQLVLLGGAGEVDVTPAKAAIEAMFGLTMTRPEKKNRSGGVW